MYKLLFWSITYVLIADVVLAVQVVQTRGLI